MPMAACHAVVAGNRTKFRNQEMCHEEVYRCSRLDLADRHPDAHLDCKRSPRVAVDLLVRKQRLLTPSRADVLLAAQRTGRPARPRERPPAMTLFRGGARNKESIMKRVLTAVLVAAACVVAATPGLARGGFGHGGGFAARSGFVRNPTTLLGSPAPQMPTFENRIPAPLAAPSQAPAINGPSGRSPYGGVM